MTTTTSARYGMRGVTTLVGESPARKAARTVWGATPSRMNSGMKTGASSAHLAITCGMMKLAMLLIRITPMSSQTAPIWRCSLDVAELDCGHVGDVAEVEVGDGLGDEQEQEE